MVVKILAVSDQIDPRIHSASVKDRMGDVDLVIGCGDLPARYLEFLADALNKPVYFVLGNHLEELTRKGARGRPYQPMGCVDLGGKVMKDESTGILLAGIPGSPRYRDGEEQQYTESEIRFLMCRMKPRLIANKLRYGRSLDLLVTHSPPRDVNDRDDPPHRGFIAMRSFLHATKPSYHVHGHVHLYDRSEPSESMFEETAVINVYPYKVLTLDIGGDGRLLPRPHVASGST